MSGGGVWLLRSNLDPGRVVHPYKNSMPLELGLLLAIPHNNTPFLFPDGCGLTMNMEAWGQQAGSLYPVGRARVLHLRPAAGDGLAVARLHAVGQCAGAAGLLPTGAVVSPLLGAELRPVGIYLRAIDPATGLPFRTADEERRDRIAAEERVRLLAMERTSEEQGRLAAEERAARRGRVAGCPGQTGRPSTSSVEMRFRYPTRRPCLDSPCGGALLYYPSATALRILCPTMDRRQRTRMPAADDGDLKTRDSARWGSPSVLHHNAD